MTAPTPRERKSERVTLWRCATCGRMETYFFYCTGHTELTERQMRSEPIVYAPLPSAETRSIARAAMDFCYIDCEEGCPSDAELDAALAELREAWGEP